MRVFGQITFFNDKKRFKLEMTTSYLPKNETHKGFLMDRIYSFYLSGNLMLKSDLLLNDTNR